MPYNWDYNHEVDADDDLPTEEDVLRSLEADAAIAASPVGVRLGRDRSGDDETVAGVQFQACGGGRRYMRKRL